MATKEKGPKLVHVPPKSLVMNKQVRTEFNERADKELTASVKKHGVMQPIQARMVGGKLHVVAGHRRTMAAIAAELESVPVYVSEVHDNEILVRQMVENLQREGLTLLDTARGVKALHEAPGGGLAGLTAERLGKSNAWVSKMLLVAGGDKANPDATITKKLLEADKIGDLESAYMLTKLEAINPIAAQEVADNIENESRASIKKKLAAAKPVKAKKGADDDGGNDDDNGPMIRWILKVVEAASVSRKDGPLQEAAVAFLNEMLEE